MKATFNLQGHRGARGLRLENTLPSFEIALDLGVTSVETDLHLSQDRHVILCHDPILPGGALVAALPLADLRRVIVAGNSGPGRFPQQLAIPTPLATYSTPADLLALGRAAMALPVFRATVDLQAYHLADRNGHHAYTWRNTNLLIGSYAGADGIKTGSTSAAGYCLLFEAQRGTSVLIGVVLHSTTTTPGARFTDARSMLDWGFSILAASGALRTRLGSLDP